ncbi:MAG TPA: CAP domain-containing protein [Actinomycetota bacterium]|nr:CAP domain-containing protein [Actinomycetota bacterium]
MTFRRAAVTTVFLVAAFFVAPGAAVAAVEATDRADVQASFLGEVLPALDVPIGWTGDAASCDPGAPSDAAQAATLTTLNWVRDLAGVDPVTLDPALSAKAQQAALIMHANDDLDHFPPQSWRCWTQEGADAAGSSNLALGHAGAAAILGYMQDDGSGNTAVGHRRWILRPETGTFGSGSTSRANALWVFGDDAPGATVPQWVPWPVAGFFPSPLEPLGRWSLSASDDAVSFANATVTVAGPGGASLPVQTYPEEQGFGDDTLVWEVSGLTIPDGDEPVTYHVSVTGISGGSATSHEYDVHLFSPPLTVVSPPSISGRARVGRTLRVEPGEWTPDPDSFDYQWLRAGVEVEDATDETYTLRRRDRGKRITVRVTAERAAYADGSATSPPTRKVARRTS